MKIISKTCCGVLMALSVLTYGSGASLAEGTSPLSPNDERHVISDPRTGLALFGYDPVAYHTENRAMEGSRDHQAEFAGHTWRFLSEANRAAFLADPTVYVPRFGGHDGARVGENVMVTGDPELFVIAGGRVVFFRSVENRDRFASDEALRQDASRRWRTVARQQALQ